MTKVIIDTGPLVALLDDNDRLHSWACDELTRLRMPLVTCDAVLTEALFLINDYPRAISQLGDYLRKALIVSEFSSRGHAAELFALMQTYKNIPMSFADACLVRMVEISGHATLFTADSHFTIYRQHRRRLIPLLAPF